MIIAVDFDGTCVTHAYPKIGEDIGAAPVLMDLVARGHQLILFTMRSGATLQEAVNWFADNEIPLWGIQSNPDQKSWTDSPKAYAQLYIDDAALGCPLIRKGLERPYVDWQSVDTMLVKNGII